MAILFTLTTTATSFRLIAYRTSSSFACINSHCYDDRAFCYFIIGGWNIVTPPLEANLMWSEVNPSNMSNRPHWEFKKVFTVLK